MNKRLPGTTMKNGEQNSRITDSTIAEVSTTNLQLTRTLDAIPKITGEMIRDAIGKGGKCFKIIDDSYILINDGEILIQWIDRCKRLREK